MGCIASKDAVETNRSARRGGSMSMPVQVRGKSDNGFHMVALTSSTYGILKVDDPKTNVTSSHDAFHEKLKQFDFPDEMHAKSWSEVSRSLPKIPPPTRTDDPDSFRRMDSPRLRSQGLDSPRLRSQGLDSPRLRSLGLDSPRQNRGSLRGTDSPRLGSRRSLPSQVAKKDHEIINTWELMDGLDKDGNAPRLKPVPASPSVKPFERSITFSTIHTLSELDSGDPSMAIVTAPAGNGGKENAKPLRAMARSASSPMVRPMRDRLTPSSPSPEAVEASVMQVPPESNHFKSPIVKAVDSPKKSEAEVERTPSEARGVGGRQSFTKQPAAKVASEPHSGRVQLTNRSRESNRSKPPTVKAVDSPEALNTRSEAEIERTPSEARGVGGRQSFSKQPAVKVASEPDSGRVEVTNRSPESNYSKPPTVKAVDSPEALNTRSEAEIERTPSEARGVGGRQSFTKQPAAKAASEPDSGRVEVTNRSPESNHSKPPTVRAVDSPKALNAKPGAEIERANSEARGRQLFTKQPAAEPDSGRVQAAVMSLSKENPVAHPQPIPRRVEVDETSNRQVPRFASPIHVLSLAASFDLENLKNSRSQAAPGRRSLSYQQSMPSPSSRATPSVSLQSQASAPSHDLQDVRDSKGEITSISGVTDINRHVKKMSGASEEGVSRDKGAATVPSISPGVAPLPDPWARFESKCPPDGDDRVVLYTTSLRGIRKTFEDCNTARFIFESFNIAMDERDVSIHAEFRQELKELAGKPVPVPQAFIKGRYIGGLDVISELHENGILANLVGGLPPQLSRGECDGCGGVRFVPCSDCSGSTKVVNDAKEVVRCSECNENGLMRCPICY